MAQWFSELGINMSYIASFMFLGLMGSLWLMQRLSSKYQSIERQLIQLQNEVRAINSGNLGMGRKISRFADEIASVEINHFSQEPTLVSEKTCLQAGVLLSRGATIEEVVDSCDISPAEAELLAIMNHSTPSKLAAA